MTNNEVKTNLDTLKLTFENNKFWNHSPSEANNPASVTTTPCTHHSSGCSTSGSCGCNSFANGIQCFGFALYMAYRVFGSYPVDNSSISLNGGHCGNGWVKYGRGYKASLTLEPGDIVRTGTSNSNGHSAIVWTAENGVFQVGEVWGNPSDASKNCKINWGNFNGSSDNRSISEIVNEALYIMKAPKTFNIKNAGSNSYLSVMGTSAVTGGRCVQLASDGSEKQKWIISSTSGKGHIIPSLNTSLAIKYISDDDEYCRIYTLSNSEAGIVTIVPSGSYYKINTTKDGTDFYLAADASGGNVYWTEENSTAYQKWTLTQVS
ncbi:MAG: RICIN domain-containing protein [Eubacteriales bacterium]